MVKKKISSDKKYGYYLPKIYVRFLSGSLPILDLRSCQNKAAEIIFTFQEEILHGFCQSCNC